MQLVQGGVGITDEPDITLVSLTSDVAEASISKSPQEKGQNSLLSFEEHEMSSASHPSNTPKAQGHSPNSMLKNATGGAYAAYQRSKVTKGVTWKVDDDGNLMQRQGLDLSRGDRSGVSDSDGTAGYSQYDYSADLETSGDKTRNYSTDEYGSHQDGKKKNISNSATILCI